MAKKNGKKKWRWEAYKPTHGFVEYRDHPGPHGEQTKRAWVTHTYFYRVFEGDREVAKGLDWTGDVSYWEDEGYPHAPHDAQRICEAMNG
jgi:hypothetical protein